ncbi:MAG: hypothetical protein HKN03_06785 [Acidimicrobiales bacterium]|nr:hypothetical protein [Acidimicrobiales bacterium]
MEGDALTTDGLSQCAFDPLALQAAFGTTDVPTWLTDRLQSAFDRLDTSAIDLRAGAATIDLRQSPEWNNNVRLLVRALFVLRHGPSSTTGGRLLELIARRLAAEGHEQLSVAAAHLFTNYWRAEAEPQRAQGLLTDLLAAMTSETAAAHAIRQELVLLRGTTLLEAGSFAEAEKFLLHEVAHPDPFQSLRDEATLLALRSKASRKMGDSERAQLLLADAESLVSESSDDVSLLRSVTIEHALADTNAELLRLLASRASPEIQDPPEVELLAATGEAFVLLSERRFLEADQRFATIYLQARRQHLWRPAVRALTARGVARCSDRGVDPTALQYLAQAVLLAEDRTALDQFSFALASLGIAQLEAGLLNEARQTRDRLESQNLQGTDRFDADQFGAELSLALGDLEAVQNYLLAADEVAESLATSQDTGQQCRLWAEYYRRSGDIDQAVSYSRRALQWLTGSANESMWRSAALEAARSFTAGGVPLPEGAVNPNPGDHPAGLAFGALIDAELSGEAEDFLQAAHYMTRAHHHYEALRAKLGALKASAKVPGLEAEISITARSMGARWITEEVLDWASGTLENTNLPAPLPITMREAQVLAGLARGLGNKAVAAELFISDRTVSTHVSNLIRKLKVANRAQAVAWWTSEGSDRYPLAN